MEDITEFFDLNDGQIVHPKAYVSSTARIGSRTIIFPNAYIGPDVVIGQDCVIGPGTCIGQPGFGYFREGDGQQRYRSHPFGVVIGSNVHIGANTCIDRGRHRNTVVGEGTRIDNLVHIAHNVRIGRHCLIIALSQISGSCEIEDYAHVAPSATLKDHTLVGRGSLVGLGAVVIHDVAPETVVAGSPARVLPEASERLPRAPVAEEDLSVVEEMRA